MYVHLMHIKSMKFFANKITFSLQKLLFCQVMSLFLQGVSLFRHLIWLCTCPLHQTTSIGLALSCQRALTLASSTATTRVDLHTTTFNQHTLQHGHLGTCLCRLRSQEILLSWINHILFEGCLHIYVICIVTEYDTILTPSPRHLPATTWIIGSDADASICKQLLPIHRFAPPFFKPIGSMGLAHM